MVSDLWGKFAKREGAAMGIAKEDEKGFQNTVTTTALAFKWLVYHTHDSRNSVPGFPDLTLVNIAQKRLVFAELKKLTGKYAIAQDMWLSALAQVQTVEVYRWKPADWDEVQKVLTKGPVSAGPACPEGMHRHLCPKCGTLWAHSDVIRIAPDVIHERAHQCPKCGREEFTKYEGANSPEFICHHSTGAKK